GPAEARHEADDDEQYDPGDRNEGVLTIEVSLGAYLYRLRDFAHAIVAGWLFHDPAGRDDAVKNRHDRAGKRDPHTVLLQHRTTPFGAYPNGHSRQYSAMAAFGQPADLRCAEGVLRARRRRAGGVCSSARGASVRCFETAPKSGGVRCRASAGASPNRA